MDYFASCKNAAHTEVLELLETFSAFGATQAGGVSRLACDFADGNARDFFVSWLRKNGFSVRIDAIGNIFGLIDFGLGDPNLSFFCGSHLDSQPDGGRFDGALGVIIAMMVAKTIKTSVERGELAPKYCNLVVVSWTSEEGARFQPSLLGSGVFTGALPLETALQIQDADGVSVQTALSQIGYLGADSVPVPNYYFEVHIEQGTKLEAAEKTIGVVEKCWGAVKLRVCVHGRADHTGPTPMAIRKDALLAASFVVVCVNELSKASDSDLYTSVGRMEILPNSPNTIADEVRLWVELRSDDQAALSTAMFEFRRKIANLIVSKGCRIVIEAESQRKVTEFNQQGRYIVEAAVSAAGFKTERMSTIAGHDVINLQSICPASLIFVPSRNGVSHAPDEFTSDKDVIAGYEASLTAISSLLVAPVVQLRRSTKTPRQKGSQDGISWDNVKVRM